MPTATNPTPLTPEEEIEQLQRALNEREAKLNSLLNDPDLDQFKKLKKNVDKKEKTIAELRREVERLQENLALIKAMGAMQEPSEDGYYLYTHHERAWNPKITQPRVEKRLLLKAIGEWFDLSTGASTAGEWNEKKTGEEFRELLRLGSRTIEAKLERLDGLIAYPYELLQDEDALDFNAPDEDEDDQEGDGE